MFSQPSTLAAAGVFAGQPLATLQAWLSKAQLAYFNLSIGLSATEIVTMTDVVKYAKADQDKLAAMISQLQAAIAGRATSGAIGVVF